jgi:uncharacterized membrane protein
MATPIVTISYISGGTLMNKDTSLPANLEILKSDDSAAVQTDTNSETVKPDKRIAVTAFIFGILGILFVPFAALIAIILGHLACSEKYEHKHKRLSKAAVILGYTHIGFIICISISFIILRAIMVDF